ncbi:MAG: NAD-dependent epimerase/dehydratase family protein [Gammaproteobacteria bacterium]|nr:NAD-dependent epimerase/dehydratase family protein [Gammaproteobacteria bacterium]
MNPPTTPGIIQKALVTGASGFLGRHLIEELLRLNVSLRALVRDPDRSPWLTALPVEVVKGDITDPDSLTEAVKNVDTVFHLAAVQKPAHLPWKTYSLVNAQGTANLIHACRSQGQIQQFVHASTVAVYGPCQTGVAYSESTTAKPIENYAITKLEAEKIVLEAAANGFPVVITRLEWVYGPHSFSTLKLFQKIAAKRLILIGPCKNTHQPVWVGDAIDGLIKCATLPNVLGQIYNLAGPQAITVQQECRYVASAVGATLPGPRIPLTPVHCIIRCSEALFALWGGAPPINSRQLDFFRSYRAYSIDKAKKELGWQPQYNFETGAEQTANWLKANDLI